MNQQEVEATKCREFGQELNRLAGHDRYRFLGHFSELESKYFSEHMVKDRRTSKELHIECVRFAQEWMIVEKANLQLLERRFAQYLPDLGYENFNIYLQTREPHTHPLQKLNRTGVYEVARNIKQFLVVQRQEVGEQRFVKFNLDDFVRYAPLARIFQSLAVTKVENSEIGTFDGGPGVITVGVIGNELRELETHLQQVIASKLHAQADILLIYSEGPLFLFDVPRTVARLKEIVEGCKAQQSFGEAWFLAHYRTGDQKLYQVM